jgi:predicted component of type VI protein secretion system
MFVARLFDRSDPDRPVGAHMLAEGIIRIGRDPAADWAIADPDCEISRQHLELVCHGSVLLLRPLGANGVFDGASGERLADGEAIPLAPGAAVAFGRYRMVIESAPGGDSRANAGDATMVFAAPFGPATSVRTDWADAGELEPIDDEGSLLEAFCEGARLDVSALSNEDPAEILRRAGHIYRQMILGLSDLMSERSMAKSDLHLEQTTIGAQENNPFKWAPTRKLATDLLLGNEASFLAGPEAIRASFEDLKTHMLGTLAGFDAAVRALLDSVSPAAIERQLEGRTGFLKSRGANWRTEYERTYAALAEQAAERRTGPVSRAFVAGYRACIANPAAAADRPAPSPLDP